MNTYFEVTLEHEHDDANAEVEVFSTLDKALECLKERFEFYTEDYFSPDDWELTHDGGHMVAYAHFMSEGPRGTITKREVL